MISITAASIVLLTAGWADRPVEYPLMRVGGATAFVVDNNLLLHCIHGVPPSKTHINLVGGSSATRVSTLQMNPMLPGWHAPANSDGTKEATRDGVTVWQLPQRYHTLQLARDDPEVGDFCRVQGYPEMKFEQQTGRVKRIGKYQMEITCLVRPGYSGGPVLNAAGEVIGMVCSVTGPQHTPHQEYWGSGCVKLSTLKSAVAMAQKTAPGPELLEPVAAEHLPVTDRQPAQAQRQVVAFVTENCGGCDALKNDIKQGHFRQFNMVVENYSRSTRTWQDGGELFEEFCRATKYNGGRIVFPVVWVRGSTQYKSGYLPARRGGLIGFIAGILDGVAAVVVGEPESAPFPQPYPLDEDEKVSDTVPKPETTPAPTSDLRKSIDELREDITAIKSGNLFEKIGAVRSLRDDVAAVKAEASDALTVARSAESDVEKKLTEQADQLRKDIENVRSGNPFLKAKGALALKKDVKSSIDLVKGQVTEIKALEPAALIGLIGAIRAFLRRRKEDQEADELAQIGGAA